MSNAGEVVTTIGDTATVWPAHARVESTSDRSGPERFDFWREVICDVFVRLDSSPYVEPPDFSGRVASLGFGAVTLHQVDAQPHRVVRTRNAPERAEEPYYLLSLQLSGQCRVTQDGRTTTLGDGAFAIYDTTRPYELSMSEPFSMLVLQLPHRVLDERVPRVAATTAVSYAERVTIAPLLLPTLQLLLNAGNDASPIARSHLASAAADVVAAVVADVSHSVLEGTTRADHLNRVKAYVATHFHDPSLTPEQVAQGCFVSLRYLHELFRDEPTTCWHYVVEQRLARVHDDLIDPRCAHRSVSDIARAAGFTDRSHFARSFRAKYGLSAREHRLQGRA